MSEKLRVICCVFLNGMDLVLCNCTEREGGEQRIVDVEESARDAIIIVFPSWLRKALHCVDVPCVDVARYLPRHYSANGYVNSLSVH